MKYLEGSGRDLLQVDSSSPTSSIRRQGLLQLLKFGLAIFFWVVNYFLFSEVGSPLSWEYFSHSLHMVVSPVLSVLVNSVIQTFHM
jgi:hypothetical protein